MRRLLSLFVILFSLALPMTIPASFIALSDSALAQSGQKSTKKTKKSPAAKTGTKTNKQEKKEEPQPPKEDPPKPDAPKDEAAKTVYITKTGKKYHKDGCRFLTTSKTAISLTDAKKKGYEPCKKCKP